MVKMRIYSLLWRISHAAISRYSRVRRKSYLDCYLYGAFGGVKNTRVKSNYKIYGRLVIFRKDYFFYSLKASLSVCFESIINFSKILFVSSNKTIEYCLTPLLHTVREAFAFGMWIRGTLTNRKLIPFGIY